ncbi:hypothetical protein NE848_10360 [Gramella jeungdoensis]|uniref:Phosphatidate cytidylyltransferase n=1 Tax=Gramella jeungdoensis TaxID=708091 RepID=A0ABT0Z2M8_9FLAO|nr:hypothetical protein [Gramella jeungdoensis]MCM8569784.1 hypothetical protein [Gramella jeungdoensis]
MKKNGIIILAILVIAAILYATFVIALIKVTLGLILIAVTVLLVWLIWHKIKKKTEDRF